MRVIKPVLLLAAAMLAACGPSAPKGPADPKLSAFIPTDTVVLAGIRVEELKQTPLYREVEPLVGSIAQEGFDPRRDVREVLVASDGKNTVAMALGKFNVKELERLPKMDHRGVTLYGNEYGAVAWIDESTIAAGMTPMVRRAIDQQKSGTQAATALLAQARALPSPNQLWMVSIGAPTFVRLPNLPNAEMLQKMLHAMRDVQFYADLRQGIFAALTGQSVTEADAKFLGDTVRGLIGLGRLSMPRGEPELLKAFDGVTVTQTGTTVSVNAKIPQELAAKVMERLRSSSGEPRRRESMPRPR
jgi:hypothetical protein